LMEMCNFNCSEFERLWRRCSTILTQRLTMGRGNKTDVTPKDLLFIVLCVLKAAINWDLMGSIFEKKGPTLQRLFSRGVEILSPFLCEEFVISYYTKLSMRILMTKNAQFKNFPCALYATDVIFQQANRPSLEGKLYFSGKHKLYGYKTEVSVAPTGHAIDVTAHRPGSVSDLVIFQGNLDFHKQALAKHDNDDKDNGFLSVRYPDHWAVLLDKGCQGAQQYVRAILSKKKTHGKLLSVEDENWNATVASDRIIVDNFFGRLTKLWAVISTKFRWTEEGYDDIFRLCVALTNFHVSFHPLCDDEDAAHYNLYKNRNYIIGERIVNKRKATQKNYRERRRIRQEIGQTFNSSDSSLSSESM